MSMLADTILQTLEGKPEGFVLSPKEFLHIGNRAAVDQTFARLVKAGLLLRIGRGSYAGPIATRFGKRPPSTEALLQSIAASTHETVVANGAAAANALGLSTQVPAREVYLTSGRPRTFTLGRRRIELRHAPRWQLVLPDHPAGEVIRAVAWLGPEEAAAALASVRCKLSPEEWNAIISVRAQLPDWMAKAVSEAHTGG